MSKKELGNQYFFWIGIIVYSLSFTLSYTPSATNIYHAIQLIGVALIIIPAIFLAKLYIGNGYLKFIYVIFLAWSLLVILRGFQMDGTFIKNMIYNARYGILPYFVPLILLIPIDRIFLKKLVDCISIFAIFYFVFNIIFIGLLSGADQSIESQGMIETFAALSMPSGFLLLTYRYHSKTRNLFALFIILLSLFVAIKGARRGLIFMYSSLLLFSYIGYSISSKKKILILYLTALTISVATLYVSNIYKVESTSIFNFVAERGTEDTRTNVELYFYDDLKTKDWIIGKGINGKYYCPNIDVDDVTGYRNVIETDYLQLILNGGVIYIILLLLILIPAIILGLFFSKNMISKAAAIWIFLWIIFLYPARVSTFSLQYILVWISVGICYSKSIRCESEKNIERLFNIDTIEN